jgi:hypothetical protein
MKTVTSSSLSKFRECPRKYSYEYELMRVPVSEAGALAFGKAWHGALQGWWMHGMECAIEYLKRQADRISPQDAARLCALLTHYNPPREQFEVMGVELPFEVKIENPDGGRSFYGYRLAGKIDVLVKRNGDLWVIDHKTTVAEIMGFGTYWQGLQIDGQMNNYCLAQGAAGFIYDVVRKPSIKLCGKDETEAKKRDITPEQAYQERCEAEIVSAPETVYQWREHHKGEGDLLEARLDLWQQVEMLRACENDNRYPRNCNSCVTKYGTCPYLDVCSGRADINDESRFRTKVAANEELQEEAA